MPLLDVQDLTKHYGETEAVRGISFQVEHGRCVALLGQNGAGKTTTLKMLAGLISPTSGVIRYDGPEDRDPRAYLGYLPQNPGFHEWMTGLEFLLYVGRLAGIGKAEVRSRSLELLRQLGLAESANRSIGGYSGGMKQRLGLAQALVHRPKLLILDEPVSALDPIGRRDILELLSNIRRETTILYSTHVLHDAEEISDDVLILVDGKMVIAGPLSEVQRRSQRPKMEITAETSLMPFHRLWASLGSVERIEGSGNHVAILVNDMATARKDILRTVMDHNIPVLRMDFGQSSLEDLFMEMVKS